MTLEEFPYIGTFIDAFLPGLLCIPLLLLIYSPLMLALGLIFYMMNYTDISETTLR